MLLSTASKAADQETFFEKETRVETARAVLAGKYIYN